MTLTKGSISSIHKGSGRASYYTRRNVSGADQRHEPTAQPPLAPASCEMTLGPVWLKWPKRSLPSKEAVARGAGYSMARHR